jgi:hypothetical protein
MDTVVAEMPVYFSCTSKKWIEITITKVNSKK